MKELVLHALRDRPDAPESTSTETTGEEELQRAAQGLGLDMEQLRAQRVTTAAPATAQGQPDGVMDVWPELWVALQLFLACRNQFELKFGVGVAQWQAARAVNVEQTMQWLGILGRRRRARTWSLYRLFEGRALQILNKRLSERAKNHSDC